MAALPTGMVPWNLVARHLPPAARPADDIAVTGAEPRLFTAVVLVAAGEATGVTVERLLLRYLRRVL